MKHALIVALLLFPGLLIAQVNVGDVYTKGEKKGTIVSVSKTKAEINWTEGVSKPYKITYSKDYIESKLSKKISSKPAKNEEQAEIEFILETRGSQRLLVRNKDGVERPATNEERRKFLLDGKEETSDSEEATEAESGPKIVMSDSAGNVYRSGGTKPKSKLVGTDIQLQTGNAFTVMDHEEAGFSEYGELEPTSQLFGRIVSITETLIKTKVESGELYSFRDRRRNYTHEEFGRLLAIDAIITDGKEVGECVIDLSKMSTEIKHKNDSERSLSIPTRGSYTSGGIVQVRGYIRKDGTYVKPHTRTAPDGIKSNNKSHRGR